MARQRASFILHPPESVVIASPSIFSVKPTSNIARATSSLGGKHVMYVGRTTMV